MAINLQKTQIAGESPAPTENATPCQILKSLTNPLDMVVQCWHGHWLYDHFTMRMAGYMQDYSSLQALTKFTQELDTENLRRFNDYLNRIGREWS